MNPSSIGTCSRQTTTVLVEQTLEDKTLPRKWLSVDYMFAG